jgi:hypothetical protein
MFYTSKTNKLLQVGPIISSTVYEIRTNLNEWTRRNHLPQKQTFIAHSHVVLSTSRSILNVLTRLDQTKDEGGMK